MYMRARRSLFAPDCRIVCGRWQRPRSRQTDVSRAGRAVPGYVGTLNFRLQILPAIWNLPIGLSRSGPVHQALLGASSGLANQSIQRDRNKFILKNMHESIYYIMHLTHVFVYIRISVSDWQSGDPS